MFAAFDVNGDGVFNIRDYDWADWLDDVNKNGLRDPQDLIWGDDGENEVILDQFDTMSVPPGVMRGFRNESEEHGFIMAILGGSDSGNVDWAEKVLERARQTGLALDEDGRLVELAPGE